MPRTARKPATPPAPKRPRGRQTIFTDDLAQKIALHLANGKSLASICAMPGMPEYSTVRTWEREKPELATLFAQARVDGTNFIADDCMRIADDKRLDPHDKRIMIDTRLRLIGKWNAKIYGDRPANSLNVNAGAIHITLSEDDLKL